ncbi:hypothetical protein BKA64DRAFT_755623 [Cadophora sp. MPI-SDFR-AT-0126]|nr:hypothetical protein BKA64DRAFT_755623 [Leotiomycetes sp. MPI-SDFR-AT-0126]
MRIGGIFVVVFCLPFVVQAYIGGVLEKKTVNTVAAPNCSLTCLGTLIPQYCDSLTDTTCICTNTELASVLLPCAVAACNVTDSLQLARYQAEVCEIPNDMTRYWQQIHTYIVLVPLTTLFVSLRIFARLRLNIGIGPDDYVLLVALAFYLTMTSTAWVIAVTGFGQHTFWLLTRQVVRALKFFWISELLYLSAITFTKLSLLLFFRRIFPSNGFRKATVWAGAFIITSNISLFMALAFQCMPVHGVWTNWMYKTPPVQCINVFAAVYIAAGMSITHDILILCMPIPTLWSLNLGLQKKINLMVMFGVGSFVIVASVIRLPSLMKMGASSDPSFDQAPVAFWTNLEVSVGIICACLPACRSLIGFYFPRLQMSLNNTSSNDRNTPGYTNPTSSKNTNEYFSKKRAARDSFLELDDRSGTGSQEELKSSSNSRTKHNHNHKTNHTTTLQPKKSFDHRHENDADTDGDSILHIQGHYQGTADEPFSPAARKAFGHVATVEVGMGGGERGSSLDGNSGRARKGGDIVMTRTLDQSTTFRE